MVESWHLDEVICYRQKKHKAQLSMFIMDFYSKIMLKIMKYQIWFTTFDQ